MIRLQNVILTESKTGSLQAYEQETEGKEIARDWRKRNDEELRNLYTSSNIVKSIKCKAVPYTPCTH
jgi:hypothetical protein